MPPIVPPASDNPSASQVSPITPALVIRQSLCDRFNSSVSWFVKQTDWTSFVLTCEGEDADIIQWNYLLLKTYKFNNSVGKVTNVD